MKFLTIIRHAKSDWCAPDTDDIARVLNKRGKDAIVLVGNYLLQEKIMPDLIISSPATRALDTAKGIGGLVNYSVNDVQVYPEIYFGSSQAVVSVIKNMENGYNDVFLFGHEPVLSSLIFHFTKTTLEKFPTCSFFRIAFDINEWNTIKTGKTECFITPKQLVV